MATGRMEAPHAAGIEPMVRLVSVSVSVLQKVRTELAVGSEPAAGEGLELAVSPVSVRSSEAGLAQKWEREDHLRSPRTGCQSRPPSG